MTHAACTNKKLPNFDAFEVVATTSVRLSAADSVSWRITLRSSRTDRLPDTRHCRRLHNNNHMLVCPCCLCMPEERDGRTAVSSGPIAFLDFGPRARTRAAGANQSVTHTFNCHARYYVQGYIRGLLCSCDKWEVRHRDTWHSHEPGMEE